ncbi:hypothetical protein [Citricoccus sp. CH26A]|uniref:hypothetical protein n=1 Tax=Citricoccus TaxID=169133 RepID=UPI0011458434|nr:hypothetical protein [Citricoccus sp. CH26A]
MTDPSMGRRYCSDAHRQAAYRARCRSVLEKSEVDQLRAQVRSLKDDRRLLEVQLQGAESRAADAAQEAEQYATMWDKTVRSNALLVSALAASEEQAEKLRTELETSGVRHAYRYGYEKGHMDAADQMARREDVDYLTAMAQMAGYVEGYEDGSKGRPKLTLQDMLPRH